MRCNLVAGHGALAVALTLTACGGSSGTSGSPSAPTPTATPRRSRSRERGALSRFRRIRHPRVGEWSCGATMMVSRITSWQTMGPSTRATSRLAPSAQWYRCPRVASTITARFTRRPCSARSAAEAEKRPRHVRTTATIRPGRRGNRQILDAELVRGTAAAGDSSSLPPVTSWIIIASLVGIVGVGFAVTRFRRRRGRALLDLGAVSQHWITEQQAGKHSDR